MKLPKSHLVQKTRWLSTALDCSRLLSIALCILLLSSCASIDPEKERKRQTEEYTAHLQQLEKDYLSHPLTLDDCIRIALTNGFAARKADLDVQLAKFNRATAFSTFLPQVALSTGYTEYNKDPVTSPQDFRITSLQISMPIFAPSTWFLYGAAQNGYASSEIAAAYKVKVETIKQANNLTSDNIRVGQVLFIPD